MRSLLKAVLVVPLGLLAINSFALAYYVSPSGLNTNAGTTKDKPFKTISKAVTVIKEGDRVHVAPGTYAENIYTTVNGSATARIRFMSDSIGRAKIVPPAGSTKKTAFDNRGSYVTIDGFEVDGSNYLSGTKWTVGINVGGAGDSVINCHVHHIYNAATDVGNSGGGAAILLDSWYGFNNMHAHKNIVHHVGPSVGGNWYQGIYQTAKGTIKNNIAYAVTGYGIHCWHDAQYIDIANNTVFGCGAGYVIGGGDFIRNDTCRFVTVTNNIAFDNKGIGFDEWGRNAHNTFKNNLCFKNGTNWRLVSASHSSDVTADPLFVNYIKTGGGDYRPRSNSLAVNAGLPTYAPLTDYDGIARPQGGAPDIGAYEYVATSMTDKAALAAEPRALVAQPNPFRGALEVRLNGAANQGASVLTVYDVRGKAVHKVKFTDGRVSWNAEGLPAGAYLVRVRTTQGKQYETRSLLMK